MILRSTNEVIGARPEPLRAPQGGGEISPGLYVHVPFCTVRCSYCDFHVTGFRAAIAERYVEALLAEATLLAEEGFRPRTIFIGGGTPSTLPVRAWAALLEGLASRFGHGEPLHEWTIEANPGTIDREKARVAREAGVDRISTGAQTFDRDGLSVLGREHGPEVVARAHELLRSEGFTRLGLDLILGWPGQTIASIEADLARLTAIDPEHVSVYHLSYEPGTALERRRAAGRVTPLGDPDVLAIARAALGGLSASGYTRYEVSNLCRVGEASLHNLNYWQRGTYRGIGSGSASFDGRLRWKNRPDVGAYIRAAGRPERVESEEIDEGTALEELLFLSLRLVEGIDAERFREMSGIPLAHACGDSISELTEADLLVFEEGRLRATERGFEVLDAVILRLWEDCRTTVRESRGNEAWPSRTTPPK